MAAINASADRILWQAIQEHNNPNSRRGNKQRLGAGVHVLWTGEPSLPAAQGAHKAKRSKTPTTVDRHAREEEESSTNEFILPEEPDSSDTTETPVLNVVAGDDAVIPLTAKNLAKFSIIERLLKTPHERANDEVVAEMRVLQEKLKMMRESLVDERMMEREKQLRGL